MDEDYVWSWGPQRNVTVQVKEEEVEEVTNEKVMKKMVKNKKQQIKFYTCKINNRKYFK